MGPREKELVEKVELFKMSRSENGLAQWKAARENLLRDQGALAPQLSRAVEADQLDEASSSGLPPENLEKKADEKAPRRL